MKETPTFLSPVEGPGYGPLSGLIGRGTFYWRYEAAASRQGTLTLAYRRPWEDVPPERTFTLRVTVP